MSAQTKENPSLCYQCAKCSTGCPVSDEMDMLPHQIIHLMSLGMEDRALRAKTIWMCAGCYTCAVRCPNDIDITSVMDDLRERAIAEGLPCPLPETLAFHKTFLRDVARRGRVHELRMMGEYNLRTKRPFHNADLGPKMFFKGRLHLLPPRAVEGFKRWMKKLWNH
jgi:heterodisulfide reductase subunit C2